MSEGSIFKPEKDFTKEADKVIPDAHEIAKASTTPL
jgi:26S proteasome regulatory subunit N5